MRTSTASWNMPGVVSDEKLITLNIVCSETKLFENWVIIFVFAVPGPPTSSVGCRQTAAVSRGKMLVGHHNMSFSSFRDKAYCT